MTKGKAFTLIELLVVVAIIALLVSIMVPSLSDALRRARMVVCSTQLKQIALGMNLYSNADPSELYPTFSGAYPYEVQDDPSMPGYYFSVSMFGLEPARTYKSWMDLIFPFVDKTMGVFICTGFEDPTKRDPPQPDSTHYGYNGHISWRGNQAKRPGSVSLKVWEIKRPSEIALVLDYRSIYSYCNWWDYSGYAAGYGLGEPWDYFRAHGGIQTNMAFADQHVEAIDRLDPEYLDYYHWDPLQDLP